MCTCAYACPSAPVWRDTVNGRPLRHRIAYDADGTGRHTGQRAELFANAFHSYVCTPIVRDLNNFSRWVGKPGVSWVGNVGATVCKAGMHGHGRALDLTRVQMSWRAVDCNTSWRSDRSIGIRRRYLGLVACCRLHAGTVLTAWYNGAHTNHIHVDNGVPFTVIRTNMRSDTTLVQAAANLLHGAGIAVDGVWGPATEWSYAVLRNRLGLGHQDPRQYGSHARRFLVHLAVQALSERPL